MPTSGGHSIQRLRYMVGIPIPSQDRAGRALEKAVIEDWTLRAVDMLTGCFGGATPLPAPAMNKVGDNVIFEKGQVLVLSACRNRDEFRAHAAGIADFAQQMKDALDQYAVIVLAVPSDSFLVVDLPKRRRT